MRFEGRVFKAGRWWAVEVPALDVVTQGRTKKDAYAMIADAIESMVQKEGFEIEVYPGRGDYFEVGATDQAALVALFLRQQRSKSGINLHEAAHRLGAKSHNAYARYEQGVSAPTVTKLSELLKAVAPGNDFVVSESKAAYKA